MNGYNRIISLAAAIAFISSSALAMGVRQSSGLTVDQAIDTLISTSTFREVTISPDGSQVAWSQSLLGPDKKPSGKSAIFVSSLADMRRAPVRISAGSGDRDFSEHDLAWSPDSKSIAFLSDVEAAGQLQLYTVNRDGSHARKLTNVSGFLSEPRYSPDGLRIAYLLIENATRVAGPTQPTAVETGLISEHVDEQRLNVLDVASDSSRAVTPGDLYVYEFDWAPNGKSFITVAAHGSGDNNWFIAELFKADIGGECRSIYKPPMQIAEPHWSPDGRHIAFISGLMSDETQNGGDIFLVDANGQNPQNITPGITASPSWLKWAPNSEGILFAEGINGESGLATVDVSSKRISKLWSAPETITKGGAISVAVADDMKTTAVIRHSFNSPPEIWAGQIGKWLQITKDNAALKPAWGKAESINWTSDELKVQGWLLYPQNFDSTRRYPMVVVVHGGPANQITPRWGSGLGLPLSLACNNRFVFFPNPRGSYGQGEAFTQGNVKDFGHGDLRDILAGVDQVLKQAPVDEKRLGLTGWSYGGFMTMWAVTQTTRFSAAIAGAGIANWQSYYGQNGIDEWMIPYFGASVYDDPAVYAKSTPINFIKNAKTPTLVMVGERDAECPAPQSYEFWHALKTLGVDTQLMVYAGEGHGIAETEHRIDILKRADTWFSTHLK